MSPEFLRTLHSALEKRKLSCFTGALGNSRPEKQTVRQPDHICSTCSSPLTESLHQWDQQTKTYVERQPVVVSGFNDLAAGEKLEADKIEVGYKTEIWPILNNGGVRHEISHLPFLRHF